MSYGEYQTMNVKIEYESTSGIDHRKFALEILGLAHGSCSGPEMAEKIIAALVSGDATWVLDLGNIHQESAQFPRELPR